MKVISRSEIREIIVNLIDMKENLNPSRWWWQWNNNSGKLYAGHYYWLLIKEVKYNNRKYAGSGERPTEVL